MNIEKFFNFKNFIKKFNSYKGKFKNIISKLFKVFLFKDKKDIDIVLTDNDWIIILPKSIEILKRISSYNEKHKGNSLNSSENLIVSSYDYDNNSNNLNLFFNSYFNKGVFYVILKLNKEKDYLNISNDCKWFLYVDNEKDEFGFSNYIELIDGFNNKIHNFFIFVKNNNIPLSIRNFIFNIHPEYFAAFDPKLDYNKIKITKDLIYIENEDDSIDILSDLTL